MIKINYNDVSGNEIILMYNNFTVEIRPVLNGELIYWQMRVVKIPDLCMQFVDLEDAVAFANNVIGKSLSADLIVSVYNEREKERERRLSMLKK